MTTKKKGGRNTSPKNKKPSGSKIQKPDEEITHPFYWKTVGSGASAYQVLCYDPILVAPYLVKVIGLARLKTGKEGADYIYICKDHEGFYTTPAKSNQSEYFNTRFQEAMTADPELLKFCECKSGEEVFNTATYGEGKLRVNSSVLMSEQIPTVRQRSFLSDDYNSAYLFLFDGYIKIDAKGVRMIPYTTERVWSRQVLGSEDENGNRIYNKIVSAKDIKAHMSAYWDKCVFCSFITNIADVRLLDQLGLTKAQYIMDIKRLLGYALHAYHDQAQARLTVILDDSSAEYGENLGRTGKGVITQFIQLFRSCLNIDGRTVNLTDKFTYSGLTLGHQVIIFNDLHSSGIEALYSKITDAFTFQKKGQDEMTFEEGRSPKPITTQNIAPVIKSSSDVGRLNLLIVGDYYKKKGEVNGFSKSAIIEEHQKTFFRSGMGGWTKQDFLDALLFCCDSLEQYFKKGVPDNTRYIAALGEKTNMSNLGRELMALFTQNLYDDTKVKVKVMENSPTGGERVEKEYFVTRLNSQNIADMLQVGSVFGGNVKNGRQASERYKAFLRSAGLLLASDYSKFIKLDSDEKQYVYFLLDEKKLIAYKAVQEKNGFIFDVAQ